LTSQSVELPDFITGSAKYRYRSGPLTGVQSPVSGKLLIGLLLLFGSCTLIFGSLPVISISAVQIPSTVIAIDPRERFKNIKDYVVFYGSDHVDELAQFDCVIIQPETLNDDDLRQLTSGGTLALAYLSVGEVEPYREWYSDGRVEPTWILGENPDWGSYYIDASEEGWRTLMKDIAAEYLARGLHGIFLDTVDTVDAFPTTTDGMVALIHGLRSEFPNAILVQNRGFTILDQTVSVIDAVMFEDLSTTYDFDTKTYGRLDPDENKDIIDYLVALRKESGIVVLALDYAAPGNVDTAQSAREIAEGFGFLSSTSEITLQTIPESND
jgi:uncharacterized protein (TIGR01370 family)